MLIVSKKENEVLKSIKYLLAQERLDYHTSPNYKSNKQDIVIIISSDPKDIPRQSNGRVMFITDKPVNIKNCPYKCNAIISKLVNDNKKYTSAQEEYLFREGIYSIINEIVLDFISGKTLDKIIYDTSSCKLQPNNWVFGFDSSAETYAWLSKKNKIFDKERKAIETASDVIYNDSDKEINYLSEYISLIERGMKTKIIFAGTEKDLEIKRKNWFFDILLKKAGDNVKVYFCDVKKLEEKEPKLLKIIGDGIVIYDDCVYKDDFSSGFCFGCIDCKKESIKKYNDMYDYLLDKHCILVSGKWYHARI